MAIVYCPECGKEISDKAEFCPQCGYISKHNNVKQDEISGYREERIRKKNLNYKVLAVAAAILWLICWYYEASHGVRIAEAEIYYTGANYVSDVLIIARVCAVLKPVSIFLCVLFSIMAFINKKGK